MSDELVTVATFDKRGDADVCKLVLEQEGISVFLADDNMVGGTNFFYANAVGGIKVQVVSSAAQRAADLLQGFNSNWGLVGDAPISRPDTSDAVRFPCEHCGESLALPANQRDSVQNCPHCGEYIDVPDS